MADAYLFEEIFADDFIDHTPQPNMTPDKAGARGLYLALRSAFPDFHAEIHWQTADGEIVTTYKTYYGTHKGTFLGLTPTGRKIHFETVDAMRVHKDHRALGCGKSFFPDATTRRLASSEVSAGMMSDKYLHSADERSGSWSAASYVRRAV